MDTRTYLYDEPEAEISIVGILWSLLDQWKAVLIVALVCALAVPGAKLFKDTRSYQASLEEDAVEEEQAKLSTNEAVETILSSLSPEERDAVEVLAQQQELVNAETAYLRNSLLMSMDPTHKRSLVHRYYLQGADSTIVSSLIDGYAVKLTSKNNLKEFGKVIDKDASSESIAELITVSKIPANMDSSTVNISTSQLFTVEITLPDDVDADAVSDVLASVIENSNTELSASMGPHTVESIDRKEAYVYDQAFLDRKNNTLNIVNTHKNTIKTNTSSLTTEQKTAFEKISKLLAAKEDEAEEDVVGKTTTTDNATVDSARKTPSFSIKFALIGFVLGVVMYAIAYVVIVVVRGRVDSADVLDDYTGARLLGDVYYPAKHRGLSALFHSKFVGKRRWGSKGDVTTQVAKAASTVESVCEHAGANNVHVLLMGGHGASARIAADVTSQLAASGIQATVLNVEGDVDEKVLLPVKNAIYCVDSTVKASDLWNLSCLCRSYDITQLGNLFVCGW